MGANFLQRQKIHDAEIHNAARQTYLQYLTDMIEFTLNDPEAMGGHAFGEMKIKHFLKCLSENYDLYFPALETKNPEADYVRTRMEDRMKQIFVSGDYVPFDERYDYVNDLPEIGGKK